MAETKLETGGPPDISKNTVYARVEQEESSGAKMVYICGLFHRTNIVVPCIDLDGRRSNEYLSYCQLGLHLRHVNFETGYTEDIYAKDEIIDNSWTITTFGYTIIFDVDSFSKPEIQFYFYYRFPMLDKRSEVTLETSLKALLKQHGLQGPAADRLCAGVAAEHFEKVARQKNGLPIKLPRYGEIPLYKERNDRKMNPVVFYNLYWKPYADAGLLFQNILRKYDTPLIDAIHGYCRRNSANPNVPAAIDVLPPPIKSYTEKQLSRPDASAIDKSRAWQALRRRQCSDRTKREPS